MTNTATRLITLIMILQRQPEQKAADLADRLGVSIRTLHRYFEMLDEMGIPIYAQRGRYGGFSLVRGYKLPPLVFTPQEAVTLSLGTSLVGEMWGELYQEAAQGALSKLENVLPDEQRQEIAWAKRSLVASGLNRGDIDALLPTLKILRRAVRENRRVEMTYHSYNDPQGVTRKLDPYALVHHEGWWYVVGYCQLRQDMRYFRVDRIAELTLLEPSFLVPDDFDVHTYMARQWQNLPQITVRMQFHAAYAHLAKVSRGTWETDQEQPDGLVVVTFHAPDLTAAASYALAFGPSVVVLEPPEVRQMVQEWAKAAAEQYTR